MHLHQLDFLHENMLKGHYSLYQSFFLSIPFWKQENETCEERMMIKGQTFQNTI